jgi:hypothetical protein
VVNQEKSRKMFSGGRLGKTALGTRGEVLII